MADDEGVQRNSPDEDNPSVHNNNKLSFSLCLS